MPAEHWVGVPRVQLPTARSCSKSWQLWGLWLPCYQQPLSECMQAQKVPVGRYRQYAAIPDMVLLCQWRGRGHIHPLLLAPLLPGAQRVCWAVQSSQTHMSFRGTACAWCCRGFEGAVVFLLLLHACRDKLARLLLFGSKVLEGFKSAISCISKLCTQVLTANSTLSTMSASVLRCLIRAR